LVTETCLSCMVHPATLTNRKCYDTVNDYNIYTLTPWKRVLETNSFSIIQIPCLLWNLNVHKSLPLYPILRHMNSIFIITYLFKIHFKILILYTLQSCNSLQRYTKYENSSNSLWLQNITFWIE
jgi:hypothetical protein